MTSVFFALLLVILAMVFQSPKIVREQLGGAVHGIQALLILFAVLSLASTSFVTIGSDEVGLLSRIYLAQQLPPGHIIAMSNEKGPQAEILSPGFHFRFLLNVLYVVTKDHVVVIPAGKYGKLVAADGEPLRPGQTFADQFGPIDKMLDATYFLTHHGQKGPQTAVITPGSYRINTYLWKVTVGDSTDVPKGFVAVVKSNVYSAVNLGNLSVPIPQDCQPTKETDLSGGRLAVPLVPVGCIGIWDRPLLPGRYYLNEDAYQVTPMDTRVQTWEFKGGFKRRQVALTVDQRGNITQQVTETEEPVSSEYADRAIFLKVEGWDIPQELRVLVQIYPDNAPIVVASVGSEQEVEHRIIVPMVRSIVRDATGSGFIEVQDMDENGVIKTVKRPPRVLDLLDHRPVLEKTILERMQPEGAKAGVNVKEVRFGDPAVPPELLVARLRQQLAQQLHDSYGQEKIAQDARILTENAKATADQQAELVKAEIAEQAAQHNKAAAQLEGQGQELKMEAIARGQSAQANVLGQERVLELQKFEMVVNVVGDLARNHPDVLQAIVQNASKFVPGIVVNSGNGSGGLEGAAAILGSFMKGSTSRSNAQASASPQQ
jgi:hypothetical protein